MKKHIVSILVLGLVLSLFQLPVQAEASTIKLSKYSVKVNVGKTTTLKLKGTNKKAKWSVAKGKKIIQLFAKKTSSVKVKGIKNGKAKVQCRVGKKKIYCKVTVKKITNKSKRKTIPKATTLPVVTSIPTGTPKVSPDVISDVSPSPKSSPNPYELKYTMGVAETPGPVADIDRLKVEPYLHRVYDNRPMPDFLWASFSHFFSSNILRRDIETISFSSSKAVPNDAIGSIDVSEKNNRSVMAWYKDADQDGKYEMTIGQDGGVVANENSAYLLSDINNESKEDQGGEPFVQGLENLDTSHVKIMKYMFMNSGDYTHNLNLGDSFDNSSVTDMTGMFRECYDIKKYHFGKKMVINDKVKADSAFRWGCCGGTFDRLCYVDNLMTKNWMMEHASQIGWAYYSSESSNPDKNEMKRVGNIILSIPNRSTRAAHVATSSKLMVEPNKKYEVLIRMSDERGTKLDVGDQGIEFFGTSIPRCNINVLHITDTNKVPEGVLGSFDLSQDQDGSVMAWYTKSSRKGYCDMTIGQEGGVIANEDSSYLFSDIMSVDGLENLYTNNVKNMSYMFYRYGTGKLDSLDLGVDFDTSKVENMDGMFDKFGLNKIGFVYMRSGFVLSNVKQMNDIFGEWLFVNDGTYAYIHNKDTYNAFSEITDKLILLD